jgi:hypothetical protein
MLNILTGIRLVGKKPNEQVITDHIAKLSAKLDSYEAILSKQKYLAGEVRVYTPSFDICPHRVISRPLLLPIYFTWEWELS